MKTYRFFIPLLLCYLIAPSLSQSYNLNINNHDFEAIILETGSSTPDIPGWTSVTPDRSGTFCPSIDSYYYLYEDQGDNVAYTNGGGDIRQRLGVVLRENTKYIIRAYIGQRKDTVYPSSGYLFYLRAGGSAIFGVFFEPVPPRGGFVEVAAVRDIPPGYKFIGEPLEIQLYSYSPGQVNFDNIRVEVIPLTVSGKAYVHGVVYEDMDTNGAYDYTSEYPIPYVNVTLKKDGIPLQATWTDNSGFYTFMVTETGTYEVVETTPPYFMSTTADNVFISVNLNQNTQVNFGNIAELNPYYIYGTVFDDINGNGVWDYGESPLSGVALELTDGFQTWQQVSSGEGFYTFAVSDPETYTITEQDPAGYFSTTPNQLFVNVGGDQSYYEINFGDQTAIDPYYIHGVVFNDFNANGQLNADEPGISGVSVELSNGSDYWSTVTNGAGHYIFLVMDEGPYSVEETDPVLFSSSTANLVNLNVSAATTEYVVDFGDVPTLPVYTIHGRVFNDFNLNGLPDLHEPGIKDVSLQLQNGSTTLNAITDATGLYSFAVNNSGTYTLTETDLAGYLSTSPNLFDVEVFINTHWYEKNFADYQQIGNCFGDFDHDGDVDGDDLAALLVDGMTAGTVLLFSGDYGRVDCNMD